MRGSVDCSAPVYSHWNCERPRPEAQAKQSADGRRTGHTKFSATRGWRARVYQLSRDRLLLRDGSQADAWCGAHCGATVTRRTRMHESCRRSKVECAQRAGMEQSSRRQQCCSSRVVGKAIRREAGAQQRAETDEIAQRIRARAVDVAACELTPSQVLAEVYHHHCTVRGGCLPFATMLVKPSSHSRVECGSFVSVAAPICRQQGSQGQLISS